MNTEKNKKIILKTSDCEIFFAAAQRTLKNQIFPPLKTQIQDLTVVINLLRFKILKKYC